MTPPITSVSLRVRKPGAGMARCRSIVLLALTLLSLPPLHAAAAQEAESVDLGRIEELWGARMRPSAVREMIELGERFAAANPHDYGVAWRVARGFWWLAFAQESRSFKKSLAYKGMEWAERARGLDGKRVEGHCLYALSLGEYSKSIGIATAVWEGLDSKFSEAASKAYEIDRDFEAGGPITALGRYYYMLPWPKRDLKKSRRYLEEARQRHPDALINRFYLAETYHELGEDDEARRELQLVLRANPDAVDRAIPPPPMPIAAEHLRSWFPEGDDASE